MHVLMKSLGFKPRKGTVLKCKECRKNFYRSPYHSNGAKCCSYQCSYKNKRKGKPRNCKECGKEYYRPPAQIRLRGSSYCSYPCAYKNIGERTRGKIRPKKDKLWSRRNADRIFSDYIRDRDGWTCRSCRKNYKDRTGLLHNSHFWSRKRYTTRFDPKNCIALCYHCHLWDYEKEKQGKYRDLMVNWLGQDEYKALEKRANQVSSAREEIKKFMSWISPWFKERELVKKSRPFDKWAT